MHIKGALFLVCTILMMQGCIFTPPPSERYQMREQNIESIKSLGSFERIKEIAQAQLGTCYIYGGSRPGGFDCSGFVQYVYRKARGIKLPRMAKDQAKVGMLVGRNELQKGDLLFFDTAHRGHINHSGIYLGNGQFIHASSGRHHCVTISNLNHGFYKRAFRWGRHID